MFLEIKMAPYSVNHFGLLRFSLFCLNVPMTHVPFVLFLFKDGHVSNLMIKRMRLCFWWSVPAFPNFQLI